MQKESRPKHKTRRKKHSIDPLVQYSRISTTLLNFKKTPRAGIIASASTDRTIKIWNILGKNTKTLTGHSYSIFSLIADPHSSLLISGSMDKSIRIWDLKARKMKNCLTGHKHSVSALCLIPKLLWKSKVLRCLASGSYDKSIHIRDLESYKVKYTLKGHTHGVSSIIYYAEKGYLVSGSFDYTVKIWDINISTPICIQTLQGHSWEVTQILQLKYNNLTLFASSSKDPLSGVILWGHKGLGESGESGEPGEWEDLENLQTLEEDVNDRMSCIQQLSQGCLVTGSRKGLIKRWNLESLPILENKPMGVVGEPTQVLRMHANWVKSIIELCPGIIATSSADHSLHFLDFYRERRLKYTCTHEDAINVLTNILALKYT